MRYHDVSEARFLSRPNRFIAHVELDGKEEVVHVKNTGRCRELLTPGARVWLVEGKNPDRKTRWDLIAVQKGDRLINMDSPAPNQVARAWHELGADRVILARELSLEAVRELRARTPRELEVEAFVHGAMCVSYSGRCLLSNYLTGRDAQRGACAQPCRYQYALMEEKRPGEYFPVFEENGETYIMNLSLIHISGGPGRRCRTHWCPRCR